MPFVRISIVRAQRGQEQHARELIDSLVDYYARQPGHVAGYRLEHNDGSNRFGRIGIWEREEDAERAAVTERDLALRSELNRIVDEETHQEYSFDATGPSVAASLAG